MKNILQKLHYRSFRLRLIITFSLITGTLVLAFSRVGYVTTREIYLGQLKTQTLTMAKLVASQISTEQIKYIEPDIESQIKKMYQNKINNALSLTGVNQIFIIDRQYRVLVNAGAPAKKPNITSAILLNRDKMQSLPVGEIYLSRPFLGLDRNWYFWGFFRLADNYWLGIQENARRFERVQDISRYFWWIGILGILMTIFAAWYLTNRLARPIEKLVDFSAALGSGALVKTMPPDVTGELAILSDALDKMRRNLLNHHREKEQMLAQIAHEIRNPLGGIELLAGLIREDLQKKGEQPKHINIILKEIAHLNQLITAFLNYSRPLKATPQNFHVQPLILEIADLFQSRMLQDQITFFQSVPDVQIYFDRDHLKQILLNLITNSLEAFDGNGGKIELTLTSAKEHWQLSVRDNGPGIPEEILEQIFEPFFTEKTTGTGLGLATTEKLCRENNASVFAENSADGGCIFNILIPQK